MRRLEQDHGSLLEYWVSRPEGLEHGFEVRERPAGTGPVRIEVGFDGAAVVVDGPVSARVVTGAGTLQYAGLAAWDARGRVLPAWMEEADQGVTLVVDDRDAVYPLVVDPLLSEPGAVLGYDYDYTEFGVSVAAGSDVNGDGFDDLVVGAVRCEADADAEPRGCVYLFLGSASGIPARPVLVRRAAVGVASAGDVNGDGYDDVLVRVSGGVSLHAGGAMGLLPAPDWSVTPGYAILGFGASRAGAGDVNGDGFDDVVVGAPRGDGGAFLYLGSPSGLATTPAWSGDPEGSSYYGWSVSGAGDVNGDGYDDVIVGAGGMGTTNPVPDGTAFLYLGSPSGLSTSAAWVAEAVQDFDGFGNAVAAAGDVNGDGYDDVLVGTNYFSGALPDQGAAFLFLGSADGLSATPAWVQYGSEEGAHLGYALVGAGDVDGDGYDDVVVSEPWAFISGPSPLVMGRIHLFRGSPGGLSTTAVQVFDAFSVINLFGYSLSFGDLNGDGYDDLAAGSLGRGRVVIYEGTCDDEDADGLCEDNCPGVANPEQADRDRDGRGDACDPCPLDPRDDEDGDGLCGDVDNCAGVANGEQLDSDGDGLGDACDPCATDPGNDPDRDGVCAQSDNCPEQPNPAQEDADGDGAGDACDPCPGDPEDDADEDAVCGDADNCRAVANQDQQDGDGDGQGDACDPCPDDAADDADDDGLCADVDNCSITANAGQADEDQDGVGDACDPCPGDPTNDADGDGLCGAEDLCPDVADPSQRDRDGDGVGDACDLCPDVPDPAQADRDGDGTGDACEAQDGSGAHGDPGCGCAATEGPGRAAWLLLLALALRRRGARSHRGAGVDLRFLAG